jgi:hypothetical protein
LFPFIVAPDSSAAGTLRTRVESHGRPFLVAKISCSMGQLSSIRDRSGIVRVTAGPGIGFRSQLCCPAIPTGRRSTPRGCRLALELGWVGGGGSRRLNDIHRSQPGGGGGKLEALTEESRPTGPRTIAGRPSCSTEKVCDKAEVSHSAADAAHLAHCLPGPVPRRREWRGRHRNTRQHTYSRTTRNAVLPSVLPYVRRFTAALLPTHTHTHSKRQGGADSAWSRLRSPVFGW